MLGVMEGSQAMTCTHQKWVYPEPYEDDWTGEVIYPQAYTVSTTEDIDIGRYKCTQCGEVFYYTGLWRRYFEEGVPCPGVERRVPR